MPRSKASELPTLEVDVDDPEELARVVEKVAALMLRAGGTKSAAGRGSKAKKAKKPKQARKTRRSR